MKKIGFIGLGIMGRPMAKNLLKAGFSLVVYDINSSAVEDLVKAGAQGVGSSKEVAGKTEIIMTMLPDSPEVKEAILGKGGVIEGVRTGSVVIDMSSINPLVSQEIAKILKAKGVEMLDAPVSGGEPMAIQGTLSIMVGGSDAGYARALPVLQTLGKTIVHCGLSGAGQVVKLANQVVVAIVIDAVSEALVLGSKAGVDPARIIEVLQGGLAATKVLEMRGPNFLSGTFDPGFRIRLHLKDLNNALMSGRENGVVLPLTAQVEQLMQAARVAGRGDFDHSSLITVLEDLAGFKVADAGRR